MTLATGLTIIAVEAAIPTDSLDSFEAVVFSMSAAN